MRKKGPKTAIAAPRIGEIFGMSPHDPRLVIVEDPTHPFCRPKANAMPLDERLILSLSIDGMGESVKVVKDGDNYLVAEGRQRVKNARELWTRQKKRNVPEDQRIVVKLERIRASVEVADGVADAIQNLRRVELWSVKVEAAHRSVHRFNQPIASVASRVGESVDTLRSWFKVYEGPQQIVEWIDHGKIPVSAAMKWANKPHGEQLAAAKKLIVERAKRPKDKSGKVKKVTARQRLERLRDKLPFNDLRIIAWVVGLVTDSELAETHPHLLVASAPPAAAEPPAEAAAG